MSALAARPTPSRVGVRPALWQLYLAAGALGCLLYLFVPPFQGQAPLMNLIGASSSIAILFGIFRNRPVARPAWYLFAFGQTLFFLGDVYTYRFPNAPFPSAGDALYLNVYPALIAGVIMLVRRREPRRDAGNLIDALIMSSGVALLSFVFLVAPNLHDATLGLLAKGVSVAYPLMDVFLLAAMIRLAVDSGKRQPAFYMLAASILSLLTVDSLYTLALLKGTYHHQLSYDIGWIAYYLLWGAAALHPSMTSLEEPAPDRETRLGRGRLLLLTAASMIAPGIRLYQELGSGNLDLLVVIVASGWLFLLVIGRMAGLVRDHERSVARERTLRALGASLVASAGREEIVRAALEGMRSLAGSGDRGRLCLFDGDAVTVYALPAEGEERCRTWLGQPEVQAELRDRSGVVSLSGNAAEALGIAAGGSLVLPLLVRDDTRGVLVVDGVGHIRRGLRGSLQALATTASLALESAALSEEVHRRESEARFSSLVARSSDLITVLSADAVIVYQSPSIARVLGYAPEEVVGKRFDTLVPEDDRARVLTLLTGGARGNDAAPEMVECSLRRRDGAWLQFEIMHTNLLDDEHVRGIVLNGRDVSERRAFEEQLAHQAFHDSLTKLANRALFADRVDHALARAAADGSSLAVLFADLDDFKTINDSLGHGAGDELLLEVARRLRASVRPTDTAARFGGDEFAVLLEHVESASEAAEVAERILASLQTPVTVEDQELYIRSSIGIAVVRGGERATPDELLRNADVAMYIAKRDGKGAYRVFEASMHEEAIERLELRADLQRALDLDQFELHYQPVVRLGDGGPTGVEALLRWRHPKRGLIAPGEFIPLAEEMGLIIQIGRWVLQEGCSAARELQRRFPSNPPLSVSVNISAKQLHKGDIVADVREALRDSGIDPHTLVIEITESLMMADADLAVERLRELKALGVRLAMDDFGTGYSSLSYLSRFPVDILKMDRSFLTPGAEADADLAAAVVALGGTLNLQVVAEGIELSRQMTDLRALGCDLGQGFLFARPMDFEATAGYFASTRDGVTQLRPPAPEATQDAA